MSETRRWILLRGLARGRGHWGSFAKKIQERFPHDEFEFIDLPGNGERSHEDSPLSIADFVKDLRQHSAFVKQGQSFNILAVSLGAMITVEWMREFPHEVQRAVLVCTSAGDSSPFYDRFRLRNYIPSALMAFHRDPVRWERTILEMVTNSHDRREAEFLPMVEYTKHNPIQLKNILRQLTAASRYHFPRQAPGEIKLIGSYGDRLVSPQCSLRIAERWGLKVDMHSWSGHDIPVDDPEWLLDRLLLP